MSGAEPPSGCATPSGPLSPQMEAIDDPPTKRFRIPSGLDSLFQTPTAEELAALRTAADSLRASGADSRAASLYALEAKLLSALRGSARRRVAPDVEALVQAEMIAVHAGPRPFEEGVGAGDHPHGDQGSVGPLVPLRGRQHAGADPGGDAAGRPVRPQQLLGGA